MLKNGDPLCTYHWYKIQRRNHCGELDYLTTRSRHSELLTESNL